MSQRKIVQTDLECVFFLIGAIITLTLYQDDMMNTFGIRGYKTIEEKLCNVGI